MGQRRSIYQEKVLKGLANPKKGFAYIKAFLRGCLCILHYCLLKPKVKIKFPFFVYARVKVIGSGKVKIERNCRVITSLNEGLTIVTLSETASVYIGENAKIGGLTIRCAGNVQIGSNALIANCLVQDFLFFSDSIKRSNKAGKDFKGCKSIKIKANVWLGLRTAILSGSVIGVNCVFSAGAVCYDQVVKDGALCIGNLTFRPVSIESLLRFK